MNKALKLSVYCVSGEDATSFLQGQLTQDMTTTSQEWKYAAHCNPKGRVMSLYHTFKLADIHYLVTPTELAEEAIKQIQKYVMRSKVTIEKSTLNVYFFDTPAKQDQSFHQASNGDIIFQLPRLGSLTLSETPQESSHPNKWDSARIQSGIPRMHPETIGMFTPEAINLDLNAVSFTKGCYTGQEIVARMHYLGKAKQRLYRLTIDSKTPIKPNSAITSDNKDAVGFIVDIDNDCNALASLKVNKINTNLTVENTKLQLIES